MLHKGDDDIYCLKVENRDELLYGCFQTDVPCALCDCQIVKERETERKGERETERHRQTYKDRDE